MAFRPAPLLMAAATSLVALAPAHGGSLEVMPIRVEMIGEERTATVSIHNVGTEASNIQIRAVDWTQPGGVDTHTPSTDLIISPPFVTLQPDETQTLRLVIENVDAVDSERAFRLFIDEIPDSAGAAGADVQVALRLLIPVFLTPSTGAEPNLQWTAQNTSDGLIVTALNDGPAHERLATIEMSADATPLGAGATDSLGGYVLSQATRTWSFPNAPAGATSVIVTGQGAGGAIEANVPIVR